MVIDTISTKIGQNIFRNTNENSNIETLSFKLKFGLKFFWQVISNPFLTIYDLIPIADQLFHCVNHFAGPGLKRVRLALFCSY